VVFSPTRSENVFTLFVGLFVCLSVCLYLSVNEIPQNVVDKCLLNLVGIGLETIRNNRLNFWGDLRSDLDSGILFLIRLFAIVY